MKQGSPPPATTLSDDVADRWIDAMTTVLGLSLENADRTEVRNNLLVASRMAASLGAPAIDDREEMSPVFRA